MPAKPSGEVQTRTIRSRRKNGDIYVLERQTIYDPVKKCNKVLNTKLISKIPKGSDVAVPTRPKRSKTGKDENSDTTSQGISASRKRIGMMDIIDYEGSISGIDATVYNSTDLGTAQKILSVARYLLASNGQTLPGITTWQFNHPLPYEDGISEDIYHDLFEMIGRDESLQQKFFADRLAHAGRVFAYDSTTFSTYSEGQQDARYGFNKAKDGLKTIKFLVLYSIDTREPVAFMKQPGNLPDVISIRNALMQLAALGVTDAEIITDNGFYSEQNMAEMFLAHFDFMTLVKTSIKWVKKELVKHMDDFGRVSSACPFDPDTHCVTALLMHEFTKFRKYASRAKGISKGDGEPFTRRIYLHLYFNAKRRVEEDSAFDRDILELKELLEDGQDVSDLKETAQEKVKKYFAVRRYGSNITAVINETACAEQKKLHGYFALVSNCEKDPFEALRIYRKRETIESFFEADKQHVDGARLRVWTDTVLRGRMFVQFVALCYYEFISKEIRRIKVGLGEPNGDPVHDLKENLKLEKKLKTWLDTTPVYLVLQWFDSIEEIQVSNKLKTKRWSTELTARDRLFLEKLGVRGA